MYAGRIVEQSDVFETYAAQRIRTPKVCSNPSPAGPEGSGTCRHRRAATQPDADPAGLTLIRAAATPDICRVDPPPTTARGGVSRMAACHFSELPSAQP